jgi:ATP-binding cassette subfamily B protein
VKPAQPEAEDTRFIPGSAQNRFRPPKARISPNQDLPWLRRAAPLVRAHGWVLAISLLFSFVGQYILVEIPGVVGNAIDDAITTHRDPIGHYIWIIAALALGRWVSTYIFRLYLFKLANGLEYDLRTGVYEHLSRMSFGFFDKRRSGALISIASADVRAVQQYLSFAPNLIVLLAVAVLAFWKMLVINPLLGLAAMAVMPVVAWAWTSMRVQSTPVSWLGQATLAEVASVVAENNEGIRVVKGFAAEQREVDKLDHAAARVRWAMTLENSVRARWIPLIENLPRLGSAVLLLFGCFLAVHGKITVGDIVACNAYILLLQPPFRMLGMMVTLGRRASASATRIYELLDTESDIVDAPDAIDLETVHGRVEFRDVSFGFDQPGQIADGLNLVIEAGETVALVGRTGSGKSSLGRLLCRYYDIDGGAITLDGVDVRSATLASIRHHVGYAVEEPFLFSASVRDNIAYGRPDAPFEEIVSAARAASAHDFIMQMAEGYDTIIGERGYTLSGGQRQRLSMARTLLLNPAVVILDDATSALDIHTEQAIRDELRRLNATRTTLVIAHRVSTIAMADRVAVLAEGRIIATGTHRELLAGNPDYALILAKQLDEARTEQEIERSEAELDAEVEQLEVVGETAETRAGVAESSPLSQAGAGS